MNIFKSKSLTEVIVVDFGARTTKVVQVKRTERAYVLLDYLIIPRSRDVSESDAEIFTSRLDEVVSSLTAKCRNLVVVDGWKNNVFVYQDLPEKGMSPQALRKILQRNIKNYLRRDVEGFTFECTSTEVFANLNHADSSAPSGGQPEPKMLIAGGSTRRVHGIVTAAQNSGFDLCAVLVSQLCPINAFAVLHPLAQKGSHALLDLGYSSTSLTVFAEGVPVFTRPLGSSIEGLITTLGAEMGLEFDPAENVLQTMPEKILEKLAVPLEKLAEELRNTIDFYEQEYENTVSMVYVTGALTQSRSLISDIADKLVFPKVEVWNPAQSFSRQVPKFKEEGLLNDGASLSVALGAAVATLNPELPSASLIAEDIAKKIKRQRHPFRYSVWLASIMAVIFIGLAVFTQARARLVAARVDNIRESITELRTETRALVDLEQSAWKLAQLETISKNRMNWAEMLRAMEQVRAPWITVIELEGAMETERLAGDSKKPKELNILKQKLILRIKARDATTGAAAEEFMINLAAHPYFTRNLREINPVALVDRKAKQDDPKDISRSFSVFVVECHFKEKTFTKQP